MLNRYGSVEEKIQSFNDCKEKHRCNCFNKDARFICGDAFDCSLIAHYEKKIKLLKYQMNK